MIPLDDPRWQNFEGGYRLPYDASIPLRRLVSEGPSPELWEELWTELHHQGDVGSASYASVPHLVEFACSRPKLDEDALTLLCAIELQRRMNPRNPAVSPGIAPGYFAAIEEAARVLVNHPDREWNETLTRMAACCLALARGQHELALLYFEVDLQAAREHLEVGYWPPLDGNSN